MARFQEYESTATIEFECDPLSYAEAWRRSVAKITPWLWYSEPEKISLDCAHRPIASISHIRCETVPSRLLQGKKCVLGSIRERDPNRYDVVVRSGRDFSVGEVKNVRMAKKQILRRIAGVSYRFRAATSKPRLDSLLTFRNPEVVASFLSDNPFIVKLILEARDEIRKQFPDSQLFLEVLSDTEGIDPDKLYLYVSTDLSPKEARPRLKALDNDWWLAALNRAQSKLCISLEYL